MAHLWIEDSDGEWSVLRLSQPRLELSHLPIATGLRGGAVLLRHDARDRSSWFLIAPPQEPIAINGFPLLGGLHLMDDRDELRVPNGASLCFSTEMPARVIPLPVKHQPMSCPRCRQRIEPESAAVRCPQCGIWHHQRAGLECWTYAPTCALCPQPTALDFGFRWTPAEL